MSMKSHERHFLDLSAVDGDQLRGILDRANWMKGRLKGGERHARPLEGKTLAMIFDKPSTRTRVSFDIGMKQLGGDTVILNSNDSQLGRGESIPDTARVLSRFADIIMIRTTDHDRLLELAKHASVPVINGLTDDTHPCQIMADVMTFEEHKGPIRNKKLAWTGDGNNVLNSFVEASARFDFELAVATPQSCSPDKRFVEWAENNGGRLHIGNDPVKAVSGADCVVTDTWVSMGDDEVATGHNLFLPYQVNSKLMAKADSNAIFMHCLPAHRNDEVTDEVMDGSQSVVFDEAENRLHAQKGNLAWCMGLEKDKLS